MRANINIFRTGPSSLGAGAAVSEDGPKNSSIARCLSQVVGDLAARIAAFVGSISRSAFPQLETACCDSCFGDDFPSRSRAILSRRNFSGQNHSQNSRRLARRVHSDWGN